MTGSVRSALLLAMVFLVIPLSDFQPFCDKIDIPFGRPDAGRRLLLERVEDVTPPSRIEWCTRLDRHFRRATRRPRGCQNRAPSKASPSAQYRRTARYRGR